MVFERLINRLPWIHLAVLQCLYLAPIGSAASSPQYLGCFLNEDLSVSNGVKVTSQTPETCSNDCLALNYTYAEFNESSCRCTHNYMSKLMKSFDADCDSSCAGISSARCDRTHFKMFKTRNTSEESYPQAIYLGCYGEKMGDEKNRLLKFPHERYEDNTPQKCSEECFKIGFLYSGTTNGEKLGTACWCGNQYPSRRFKINDAKCNVPCSGDKTKKCGGLWRLSVYSTGIVDYPLGQPVGCFNLVDFKLPGKNINTLKENIDPHRCFYICNERQYKYAAVSEDYCECSHEKPGISEQKNREECKKCEGDESEYCGGSSSISVYENDWIGTGNLSEKLFGCFRNSWMYPVMEGWNITFPRWLTSELCVSSCYNRGYSYAALASQTECVCSFVSPSLEARADAYHCDATCPGGSTSDHKCGGRGHYNVFTTGLITSRVAGDNYMGCYVESAASVGAKPAGNDDGITVRIHFPYVNTPKICSKHCYRNGYRYYGLSYRETCWCANAPPSYDLKVRDDECSAQCPGDANKYCGGVMRTAVFQLGIIADRIENCSTICECYFLPTENATTIQCSNKNLTTAPTIFPVFENKSSLFVHLILSDNLFKVQPDLTSYRITLLDISGNGLTTLDANLLPKSLKVLYVDNNKLTLLNDKVIRLLPSLDTITLSKNPWQCECFLRTVIIEHRSKIEDLRKITCTSSTKPIILIDEYSLCKKWKIDYFYFVIIMGFVLFICFLSVYFNLHEIFWSYVRNNRWNSCNRTVSTETCSYRRNSSEVYMQRIQYDELAVATENWDQNRVLGRGGFGVVYKGNWRHTDVAIKRLKSEGIAERVVNMHTLGDEILNPSKEIMYLNAVKHDNVLPMYGFCFHATGSCLIYQYMANGSLEDRLQLKNGTKPLSWSRRANIALGTARGLQFLHNMEIPLIHGDIKSANILLDSNFEARIGDFGLARTGPMEETNKEPVGFNVSRVCGTKPYLPDDFCQSKIMSTKVDTFSFGVVMFEIATGLKAFNRFKNYNYLMDFVNNYTSSLIDIADKTAGEDFYHVSVALISLGKTCVVEIAKNRPEMVVVYMKLKNIVSNTGLQQTTTLGNDNFTSNSQIAEKSQTIDMDLMKLDGKKAALLAPLNEIPSISRLYSSSTCEINPRKSITTEQKTDTNEISDIGYFTTNF
ncbi:uncharacterized protein LOC112680294 isoform X2 [Sipha flava]|uniref:non-specific serine/threonine protein kinase n=1 Tax=Sipha flava TaxID=143950 RepID=A0A8B8F670_9HEMI|nr:uncharacterized protein LOC112680294 isoform X2 [Sipha flava]